MKQFFFALSLLLSTQVLATGGFECSSIETGKLLVVGTASRFPGEPIIAINVFEGRKSKRYELEHIVGYWNIDGEINFAVVDENYLDFDFILKSKSKVNRELEGETFGVLKNKKGKTTKVKCITD